MRAVSREFYRAGAGMRKDEQEEKPSAGVWTIEDAKFHLQEELRMDNNHKHSPGLVVWWGISPAIWATAMAVEEFPDPVQPHPHTRRGELSRAGKPLTLI